MLSVPVQVIDYRERLVSEMTYNGDVKSYSLTQSLLNAAVQHETLYLSGRTSLVRVRQIQAYTHQRSEIVACS